MNKFNSVIILLLVIILVVLIQTISAVNNLNTKIDSNQERVLNNQNAIYQIINK